MSGRKSIYEVLDKLNTVIDVSRVYPTESSDKVSLADLKTVGLKLSKSEATELLLHLALAILGGAEEIDINL